MGINVIVTGSTGMVGEGVLHECLQHPAVDRVLVLNRKPCGVVHPKLTEILHPDFLNLAPVEQHLRGFNACFFCSGVSSVGMRETEYSHVTFDLTLHVATTLARLNPAMAFCYVSGSGTDSTERGKIMWARVKGRTENALLKLPFRGAYMFRPGYMRPTPGMKNTLKMYAYIDWLYPVLRRVFPGSVSTLAEVGRAMITCATKGSSVKVLEVRDIVALAKTQGN